MDEIKTLINHKRHRLIVNISDLHNFRDLGNRLAHLLFFFTLSNFSFLSLLWNLILYAKLVYAIGVIPYAGF